MPLHTNLQSTQQNSTKFSVMSGGGERDEKMIQEKICTKRLRKIEEGYSYISKYHFIAHIGCLKPYYLPCDRLPNKQPTETVVLKFKTFK